MIDGTTSSRIPASTIVGLAMIFGTVAALGLWRASPAALQVVSYGLIAFGLLGLVFVIGIVVGGRRFSRRSSGGEGPRPGQPGPWDPGVAPLDDLDRELEQLLSGRDDVD